MGALKLTFLLIGMASVSTVASSTKVGDGLFLNGDISIGGLFPISQSGCSRIKDQRGIQLTEAMIYSLVEANANKSLLRYGKHKINLGGLLLDTCSREDTALQRTIQLVKLSLSYDTAFGYVCPTSTTTESLTRPIRIPGIGRVLGVVGGGRAVANLLRLFAVPQISYASTSAALSDKTRFELFGRTVPSDTEQARALADIVAYFNWTYVSTVFSKGDYGEGGIQSFESEAEKLGVCIAERLLIGQEPTRRQLDGIVERLRSQPRARVVVLFTRQDHTELFLDAVSRANLSSGRFLWVSADGWGKSQRPVANNSRAAEGALTLEVATRDIPGFNQYFTSLRPGERTTPPYFNTYFNEFWQQNFNCQLNFSGVQVRQRPWCNDSMNIAVGPFQQEPKVQFVYDAVYTFVHALDKVMKQVCLSQDPDSDTKANGLFEQCVKNISDLTGRELYNILISRNNSFIGKAGNRVRYTDSGDSITRYNIFSYQRTLGSKEPNDYKVVGTWQRGLGLSWSGSENVVWPGSGAKPPASVCSDPCAPGQRKLFSSNRGKRCCWMCAGS